MHPRVPRPRASGSPITAVLVPIALIVVAVLFAGAALYGTYHLMAAAVRSQLGC